MPNDAVALVGLLKSCAKQKDFLQGSRIHDDIAKKGFLETNLFVGNSLINMYAKCGALEEAQQVFDALPNRDIVSWNALIAGYAQHNLAEEALNCFERMQVVGLSANIVSFVCVLKACGSIGAFNKGQEIHVEVVRLGLLEEDIHVGTTLVDMYAKCGLLAKAQEVFDNLPAQHVVSWTALIAGYAQHGLGEEALNCYEGMQSGGFSPNVITFVCILKACGSIGALAKGQETHVQIIMDGSLEKDIHIGTTLVDMYAKCGALAEAQDVFDDLSVRDVAVWTALMAGYAQHGHSEEALNCFQQMQLGGFYPNAVTFVYILKASGGVGALDKGQELHAQIIRDGLLKGDIHIGTALVDMYAKCGSLTKAQQVFDELSNTDVASWAALIEGYAQYGQGTEALNCFECMQHLGGFSPDAGIFICISKVCGSIRASEKGQEIHARIMKEGLLEKDIVVANALVDMYVKCGMMEKAQELVDELRVRDVGLWNTFIAGHVHHEHGERAHECFEQMKREGLSPDAVTFACIMKACGRIGAAHKGQEVHAEVVKKGLLEKEVFVGTALIDMYATCGMAAESQGVFDRLAFRDVVAWNALMAGYAQLGKDEIAFSLFNKMIEEGQMPNLITFLILLNVCSRRGLTVKGQAYFEVMSKGYGIVPSLEHSTCMVDLFGHVGHLDKAVGMMKEMPCSANLTPWITLLGACKNWGNIAVGQWVFEQAAQFDKRLQQLISV